MIPFRFLHAADLHLDSRFAGLAQLPHAVRSYLRESTFAALGRLVGVAIEEKVDFVVISGDVYDVSDASLQGQLRFLEALKELSAHGIPVYLIHGNHDPLDGPRLKMELPALVTLFGAGEPGQAIACRRSDGVEVAVVSGISYPTAKVTENTALRFNRKPGSTLFHIALLHGNVDGDLQHETYSPCSRKDLIGRGFDYWALGHIHKRSILHKNPVIVYPGNIQGRSVKETGPKGCYVVDVNAEGSAQLRFHELDSVRWEVRELSIDGLTDEAEWTQAVERAVEDIREELPQLMSVVRFRLTGRGRVHRILSEKGAAADLLTELQRREAVRAERRDFAGLVWTEGFSVETGLAVDRERLLQEDSFLGEMLRLSARSLQSVEGLEGLLSDALKPLMENRELRRLLSSAGDEEKHGWLRSAAELGITLLSGVEDEDGPDGHKLPPDLNETDKAAGRHDAYDIEDEDKAAGQFLTFGLKENGSIGEQFRGHGLDEEDKAASQIKTHVHETEQEPDVAARRGSTERGTGSEAETLDSKVNLNIAAPDWPDRQERGSAE